ncbi:Actin-related protein 2/3 complex subunit 2A [Striga hermonthica]|uniref:Arp2/3 complex 34 kDa subunit n=1 Tax=Striga hermonthica TaxID=68872 RepID=A0A9N7NLJ0_STRHE|nr:Actin-related protein 2/3 complex subunit 2A [Striga hermonthica]
MELLVLPFPEETAGDIASTKRPKEMLFCCRGLALGVQQPALYPGNSKRDKNGIFSLKKGNRKNGRETPQTVFVPLPFLSVPLPFLSVPFPEKNQKYENERVKYGNGCGTSTCRYLLQVLSTRVQNLEKGVELDCQWVEFDDVRYHIQASVKNPNFVLLSLSLPTPPPETVSFGGLPEVAIEAIKAAYGVFLQILDPPRDGFNLTVKLNLSKLPPDEEHKQALLVKIASIREVVQGAQLRAILKQLITRGAKSNLNQPVSIVHRPNESFFVVSQVDKVIVIFPMRFRDSVDTVLATSFFQEFVEARRTAGLNSAPPCHWSASPPQELEGVPDDALAANSGFISFVIFPRHVEGRKLDRTVWSLTTFHAYVSYHVKCSEGFMHTRMRRRVESLIEALDRAKPDADESEKKRVQSRSFKRLSIRDGQGSFNSR